MNEGKPHSDHPSKMEWLGWPGSPGPSLYLPDGLCVVMLFTFTLRHEVFPGHETFKKTENWPCFIRIISVMDRFEQCLTYSCTLNT